MTNRCSCTDHDKESDDDVRTPKINWRKIATVDVEEASDEQGARGCSSIDDCMSTLTLCGPVSCPIANCNKIIGSSTFYSHYLYDHHLEGLQCREILLNKPISLEFDVANLKYKENVCIGMLALTGLNDQQNANVKNDATNDPFKATTYQTKYPKCYYDERFKSHMPILIMICKTTVLMNLQEPHNTELPDLEPEFKVTTFDVLIIWLVGFGTSDPIDATVTACNKMFTRSNSGIIPIRRFHDSQNPDEFIHKEVSFLRLFRGEIDQLTNKEKDNMVLDIVFKKYE